MGTQSIQHALWTTCTADQLVTRVYESGNEREAVIRFSNFLDSHREQLEAPEQLLKVYEVLTAVSCRKGVTARKLKQICHSFILKQAIRSEGFFVLQSLPLDILKKIARLLSLNERKYLTQTCRYLQGRKFAIIAADGLGAGALLSSEKARNNPGVVNSVLAVANQALPTPLRLRKGATVSDVEYLLELCLAFKKPTVIFDACEMPCSRFVNELPDTVSAISFTDQLDLKTLHEALKRTSLETLTLDNCRNLQLYTWQPPLVLLPNSKLRELTVRNAGISLLFTFTVLPTALFESVHLDSCSFRLGPGSREIPLLGPSIKRITITDSAFEKADWEIFKDCSQLESLTLEVGAQYYSSYKFNGGPPRLTFPETLTSISLKGPFDVIDLCSLLDSCPNLKFVDVTRTEVFIGHAAFLDLPPSCQLVTKEWQPKGATSWITTALGIPVPGITTGYRHAIRRNDDSLLEALIDERAQVKQFYAELVITLPQITKRVKLLLDTTNGESLRRAVLLRVYEKLLLRESRISSNRLRDFVTDYNFLEKWIGIAFLLLEGGGDGYKRYLVQLKICEFLFKFSLIYEVEACKLCDMVGVVSLNDYPFYIPSFTDLVGMYTKIQACSDAKILSDLLQEIKRDIGQLTTP